MTILVAILMAITAAVGLAIDGALAVGGGETGGVASVVLFAVGTLGWAFLFAWGAEGPRSAFRRGLITIAMESFFLPLAFLLFTLIVGGRGIAETTGGDAATAGAAIGTGLFGFVAVIAGLLVALIIGLPCLILFFALKPAPRPIVVQISEMPAPPPNASVSSTVAALVYCHQCGQPSQGAARFCPRCGAELVRPPAP